MNRKTTLNTLVFALVALLATAQTLCAQAQTATGAIIGRVSNQATGKYLGDAVVRVEGTSIETLTDTTGSFRLSGVPAGEARVSASYTDLDTATQVVTVAAGQATAVDFGLTAQVYKMEAFVVAGAREGSARATHDQRMSASQKAVFAADSFGNVVDSNIGELVKRLPGVTIDYDGEDASKMRIRGMDPSLASITLDGNPVASIGSTESRAFNLRTQSLQNIEAIEIDIAPTPDKPGNTMGGLVNFISKSALQQKGRHIGFRANLSLNTSELDFDKTPGGARTPEGKIMPGFEFSWMEAFGTKRPLGVAFNTSFNRSYRFNNNYRVPTYDYDDGQLAATGNKVTPDMTGRVPELLYTEAGGANQTRMVSLNLDWQVTPSTILFLYSTYNDETGLGKYSRTMRITAGRHTPESNFYNMITDAGSNLGMTYGVSAANSTNVSFNAGVKHDFGNLKLEYNAFYNRGETDPDPEKNFSIGYSYQGLGINVYGLAGNATGRLEQTANNGAEIVGAGDPRSYQNIENYKNLTMSQDFNYGTDVRRGGRIDATLPTTLFGRPVEFKVGANHGEQLRETHKYWGTKMLTGGENIPGFGSSSEPVLYQFADPYFRNSWSFDLPIPNWLNPYYVRDYYHAHPGEFYDDSYEKTGRLYRVLMGEKSTKEATTAGYGMFTAKLLNNLTMLAGLRYEYTKLSAEGPIYENPIDDGKIFGAAQKYDTTSQYILKPDGTPTERPNPFYGLSWGVAQDRAKMIPMLITRRSAEKSYDKYFPNIQFRYEPFKSLLLRLARTEGIGRPDFGNILPNEEWLRNYHLIKRTNPDLQPQTSEKYDFAIEYYFKHAGMLTLSLFRHNMKDIIVKETTYVTNVWDTSITGDGIVHEPDYDEGLWTVERPINFGDGRNQGFEIAYKQRLGFIANWLRDVEVYAAYSYADPKTWYMRRTMSRPGDPPSAEDSLAYLNSPREREEIPMPGIQKKKAVFQLQYFGRRFSASILAEWVDKYANAIDRDIVEIKWQDARLRYDLSLGYKLSSRWTATFDWRNFTNEGDAYHIYDRTGGYYTSGMVVNVGVRANF